MNSQRYIATQVKHKRKIKCLFCAVAERVSCVQGDVTCRRKKVWIILYCQITVKVYL